MIRTLSLFALLSQLAAPSFATEKPKPLPGMPKDWIPYATCALESPENGLHGLELWGPSAALQSADETASEGGIVPHLPHRAKYYSGTLFSPHGSLLRTFPEWKIALMLFSGESRFGGTYFAGESGTPVDLACESHLPR